MTERQRKSIAKWMDERFSFALKKDEVMGNKNGSDFLPNNVDYVYYKAICDTLVACGHDWKRSQGKHIVF